MSEVFENLYHQAMTPARAYNVTAIVIGLAS
jgi:hypothetical protein